MVVELPSSARRRVYELLRAMLRNMSWNFRAVWLDQTGPKIVSLRFLLEFENEEDREAINDIVFEFEAQQDTGIDLGVKVDVSQRPLAEFKGQGYLVYARRES